VPAHQRDRWCSGTVVFCKIVTLSVRAGHNETKGEVVPIQKASRQILAKAAVKIGGAEVLASRLEITAGVLKMYIEGDQEIPDSVLLRAIDIIIEDLPQALPDPSDPTRPQS